MRIAILSVLVPREAACSLIISQCLTEKTVEREAFLASLMQCEEGNLSCPLTP